VVAIAVQPNLDAVVSLVAVDVEVHLRVGDRGDPVVNVLFRGARMRCNHGMWMGGWVSYQYWPLPFLSGIICRGLVSKTVRCGRIEEDEDLRSSEYDRWMGSSPLP